MDFLLRLNSLFCAQTLCGALPCLLLIHDRLDPRGIHIYISEGIKRYVMWDLRCVIVARVDSVGAAESGSFKSAEVGTEGIAVKA